MRCVRTLLVAAMVVAGGSAAVTTASATSAVAGSGQLRVTTSPSLPSQILLDGVARDSYGLNWLTLPAGQYTLAFAHVEGWTEPAPQTVTVSAGGVTTVTGTFVGRGFLRAVTNPALPAGISVDGVPRDNWGVFTDLPPGSHQVCFGPVAGFTPPACQTATLTAGTQTVVTGSYVANPSGQGPTNVGQLRVTSSPAVPAQILVDGVPRDTWGLAWLELAPGPHTVAFAHVQGWTEPAPTTVTVTAGGVTTVAGTFLRRGTIEVKTTPARPGTITVDGIPRDDWGLFTDLPAGAHQVCFGPVLGFVAAACTTANLTAGTLTTVMGTYTPSPPGAPSVRVVGNKLVSASGAELKLYGVNQSGPEYACVQGFGPFDGPSDAASVAAIASWEGTNVVRIPLNEQCWLGVNGFPNGGYSAAQYRQAIVDFVARLHAHGLYAILELHWSAPGSYPATRQEFMPDADHSPAFWTSVATTFKSDPGAIFDLFNEPTNVSWACLRDGCNISTSGRGTWQVAGMQSLVNAVRTTGASNVIMLGGLAYTNDLSGWLQHKPTDPLNQLAASFHVYNFNTCRDVGCWSAQVAPVAAEVPLIAGEIGEDDGTATFINGFMAWADARGIGYLGWTWDTWGCGGPVLISNYDGTPCPGYGVGFRTHLAALP